jgi:site-specific DNA-cytosine methylase
MIKVLELFAGSRSFSRVAESPKFGFKTYATDNVEFDGIDQVCDIFDFNIEKCTWALGGSPDIVWASPPCTTFSVASFGHHWYPNRKPKTEASKIGLKIIERTVELIQFCMDLNEKCKFVIENPRGMLRKLDLIPFEMYTVTYCQYGDTRMKPTDIWTNINWIPRKMCKNGDSCHISAPRGSRTGTQGLKNNYERSKVPYQLCKELIEYYLYA